MRLQSMVVGASRAAAVVAAAIVPAACLLATTPRGTVAQEGADPDLSRWDGRLVHESWSMADGLPVNSITALMQTRDGYIWAGTFDGLVRFDGARFTIFNSAVDENLPTNRFIRMHEGRDGTLWFSNEAVVVRFRNNRFQKIRPDPGLTGLLAGLYEDRSGRIWVMTRDGLGRVDGERFVPGAEGVAGDHITSMVERRDGSLWAGTLEGFLYRLEERPGSPMMDAVLVARLESARVHTLFEDAAGRLWIGAQEGAWVETDGFAKVTADRTLRGVHKYVQAANGREIYAYAETGIFRVEEDRAVTIDPRSRVSSPARPFTLDAAGSLWYPTHSELGRDGRTVLTLGPDAAGTRAPTAITAMMFDHEGSLWIGTRAAGLHRVKPSFITTLSEAEGLGDQNVYPIHQDTTGDIWVGTYGNGLSRIHTDGRITSYTRAQGYPSTIQTLFADRPDRLWVGAGDGLFACTLPGVVCVQDSTVGSELPYALFRSSDGKLWGGFSNMAMRLDGDRWIPIPGWPAAGTVRVFAETEDGALWAGTNGGGLVRHADGASTRITASADGLPIDAIRSLYVDDAGWLWVGTEGRGLARLDPFAWNEGSGHRDRRIVSIRAADGLFDEVIHQILPDDAGRLWMSTNRGIFWVRLAELSDFADGTVDYVRSTGYTERDGLRNREANGGMQPVGIRARDGRLWFPTQDGVAVIDPDDIEVTRIPPPVIVERIVAGDSVVAPGDGGIEFGVDQRDLEIDYTALSFMEPANVRFRYRLDPYDPDWVDAGSRRTAFYTRVPPGRYTFRVTASNSPGEWSGTEASVAFRLRPRFRETRGALVLALASLGFVMLAGYRWRVGTLRRRQRELSDLVESRTADLRHNEQQLEDRNARLAAQAEMLAELHEARSRLFANLSHELRTPLTLILGPLRSLVGGRHGSLAPSVRDQHDLMLRNGDRLLALINQILDMSSLQAGGLSLKPTTADLVEFSRATTLAFAPLAESAGIDLRFDADVAALPCDFDPEHFEKVLLNLLSNAVKFTERGGTVQVKVARCADSAEIVVRDTGIGIAPDELPRIFERFYQADSSSTRRYAGTGIGLAMAKELVELHGGALAAESTPGSGSVFTVRLPMAGASPSATADVRRDRAHYEEFDVSVSSPTAGDDARGTVQEKEQDEDRTTVLVVDDNPDVRAYVRSILAGSYSVVEARDGEDGLAAARSRLPDLIVADVMMPRLDGLALGRALKEDPLTDAIPLVLLTARAASEDHVAGLETGADAYLVKPFHPDVLEACVGNLLAQRHRLRERFRQGEAAPPATVADPPSPLDTRLRPLVVARLIDPNFGPDALAADAGLSYHQLYRALRDELGFTPSAFIRRVRVECAAELLRQGAWSVTEIAYSVGFESLSYFRRAFHERFEASPTKYVASRQFPRGLRPASSG